MVKLRLSRDIQNRLICPFSGVKLHMNGESLSTYGEEIRYPIVNGIPIVINENNSIFDVDDIIDRKDKSQISGARFARWIPSISANIKAKKNYRAMIHLLPQKAKILVVGGAIMGAGMKAIYSNSNFDILGLDVYFGFLTSIIADAHSVPFMDETFDCVIIQAVIHYLVDPRRCVEEIHRTLKHNGIVYSEVSFMQQVTGGRFDFNRFTHLGLLRLFRQFEEIKSGFCCGPGMALASAWAGFLRSFATRRISRFIIRLFTHCTTFYLKYFDYYLIDKPGSYDAASGIFFLGKKSEAVLSDRDLIKHYRGLSGI